MKYVIVSNLDNSQGIGILALDTDNYTLDETVRKSKFKNMLSDKLQIHDAKIKKIKHTSFGPLTLVVEVSFDKGESSDEFTLNELDIYK